MIPGGRRPSPGRPHPGGLIRVGAGPAGSSGCRARACPGNGATPGRRSRAPGSAGNHGARTRPRRPHDPTRRRQHHGRARCPRTPGTPDAGPHNSSPTHLDPDAAPLPITHRAHLLPERRTAAATGRPTSAFPARKRAPRTPHPFPTPPRELPEEWPEHDARTEATLYEAPRRHYTEKLAPSVEKGFFHGEKERRETVSIAMRSRAAKRPPQSRVIHQWREAAGKAGSFTFSAPGIRFLSV